MYHPEKYTPAVIEFVDIAGLVRGASKGEGLGNKFLSHIREVDALVHVVRCFEDGNVIHVEGSVDPVRDIDTIRTELLLADIETTQKRADRLRKLLKNGEKSAQAELEAAEALPAHMDAGSAARTCPADERAARRPSAAGFS
jgi:ribosome-binding ATPase YchF (GTP1/OBG family)